MPAGKFYKYKSKAKPLSKVVQQNKKAISKLKKGVEVYSFDHNAGGETSSQVLQAGGLFNLCRVPVGADDGTRQGFDIAHKSIAIQYDLLANSLETRDRLVRMIVFKGLQTNGVLPTVLEVLESNTVTSFPNHKFRHKYQILWDKTHVVGHRAITAALGSSGGNRQVISGSINKKVRGKAVFTTTGNTEANMSKGGIYFMLLGDATSNYPVCTWSARYTYLP